MSVKGLRLCAFTAKGTGSIPGGELISHKPRRMAKKMWATLVAETLKSPPAMQQTGSRRSPGERNGYSLQYACLEKFTDRGAWQATVHGVSKESNRTK